jgi:hypothetical protein
MPLDIGKWVILVVNILSESTDWKISIPNPSRQLMLAIDSSGSMSTPNIQAKVDQLVRFATRQLEVRDSIGLVMFSSNIKVSCVMAKATHAQLESVCYEAMRFERAGGSTPLQLSNAIMPLFATCLNPMLLLITDENSLIDAFNLIPRRTLNPSEINIDLLKEGISRFMEDEINVRR